MKKIPLRRCVITKESLPKQELLRIVKTPEGKVIFDYSSRVNGHGAYVKADQEVIEKARKTKILEKLLEAEIDDKIYDAMIKEANERKNTKSN